MTETPPSSLDAPPIVFERLLPAGEPLCAERFVALLDLASMAERATVATSERTGGGVSTSPPRTSNRPYLALNMISTVDGRASIDGRSGPLGGRADRELFHGLRTAVDAVMAGAGTVRAERYQLLVRDEQRRRIRRERGLSEQPLACVVSSSLSLPADIPILCDPEAHVAILTQSDASLSISGGARIDYVRAGVDGMLDLAGAMAQLRERFGVRTVLCEGGPHLNGELLAQGLVDELFLSLSPKLAGEEASGKALRIVSGAPFGKPLELELLAALEHDSHLFLRYRVA